LCYSRAIFAAARQLGLLEATVAELTAFTAALAVHPELGSFWYARLPAAKKAAVATAALQDRLSALTFNFLQVLIRRRRERYLPSVTRSLTALAQKAGERRAVLVVSAVSLPDDLRGELRRLCAVITGAQPEVEFAVDADILGGIVIRTGGLVIDASVRGRLDAVAGLLSGKVTQ
jgi:F-type H+-transporting ATPase subunit delta